MKKSLTSLTINSMLSESTEKFSNNPALSFVGEKPVTYSTLHGRVKEISSFLREKGISKGDRIALLSENMPNWGITYLAVTTTGAVAVPVLTDFTFKEIKRILKHSGARAIFVSRSLYHKIEGNLPLNIESVILIDNFSLIDKDSPDGSTEKQGIGDFESKKIKAEPSAVPVPGEDDTAAILYTSGTTGNPKGVMLSHRNIISNALNTMNIQEVYPSDRLLSVLPLPHSYECTIGFIIPLMNGASVHYLKKPPVAEVLLSAMKEVKPTMMLTVPLIIEKVYKKNVLPKLSGSSAMRGIMKISPFRKILHRMAGKKLQKSFGGQLRFFGIGGAKLSADTERFLRDAGFPYAIGYGLTETSPLLAGSRASLTRYRSTGPPLPGQQLKIDNPDPLTGEGEILAKGPNIMKGYFRDEKQTAEVFTEEGWFRTGDLGVLDKDNYLYIKGRLKNMILSSTGENIYPEEIEGVINTQSMVLESLVYEMSGKLVARVHLNYMEIENRYRQFRETAQNMDTQMREIVNEKLNEIKTKVNSELNKFSRLSAIHEQTDPFEKTPTKKIKRFLYKD